jgi:hypothetical protein
MLEKGGKKVGDLTGLSIGDFAARAAVAMRGAMTAMGAGL